MGKQQDHEKITFIKALGVKEVLAISFGLVVCVSTWGAALIGIASFGFSFILTVAIASVIYLIVAASYSELATMFPKAASIRTYLEVGFNPHMGMIASLVYMLSFACGMAAEVTFFGYIMNAFVPAIPWYVWALGTSTIFGLIINLLGITRVGNWAGYLLYVVIGIALTVAFMGLTGLSMAEPDFTRLSGLFSSGFGGIFAAFLLAMWLFAGFEVVCPLAEECRSPERDLPRGMFGAILIIGPLKVLFAIGALAIVMPDVLAGEDSFRAIGEAIGGNVGIVMMVIFALGAAAASSLAGFSANSRLLYGMAQKPNNMMPTSWEYLHPKYRTPWKTLFVWWVIHLVLITGFGSNMIILLYIAAFIWICQYILILIANIRLRYTQPDLLRPFRVPGGTKMPYLTLVGLVATLIFLTLSVVPPYGDSEVFFYGASMLVLAVIYTFAWLKFYPKSKYEYDVNSDHFEG